MQCYYKLKIKKPVTGMKRKRQSRPGVLELYNGIFHLSITIVCSKRRRQCFIFNSAKNWGLVDMFGGGFFTTMLKHSKMDQAKQNMEQAKYDLRNFSKELNDVNLACDLHMDTGDFLLQIIFLMGS